MLITQPWPPKQEVKGFGNGNMYVICTGVVYLKRLQTHSLCLQVNVSSRSVESELG